MKIQLNRTNEADPELLIPWLRSNLSERLSQLEPHFIQDLSHINPAARYAGEMRIDDVEFLKTVEMPMETGNAPVHLFRCHYSYQWDIGWTCSGTSENGRVHEKVRMRLAPDGTLECLFLKFD